VFYFVYISFVLLLERLSAAHSRISLYFIIMQFRNATVRLVGAKLDETLQATVAAVGDTTDELRSVFDEKQTIARQYGAEIDTIRDQVSLVVSCVCVCVLFFCVTHRYDRRPSQKRV
jgi:hypothetical protein